MLYDSCESKYRHKVVSSQPHRKACRLLLNATSLLICRVSAPCFDSALVTDTTFEFVLDHFLFSQFFQESVQK
ncbi:hypothetical protein E2C01_031846 [Portunus trituberculatus]|uniref:Uncharacterized protein n=1 Tax=Portunus trituberculatus TaxID=210409 RepID=A0A5B7ETW4_PORTR|nr:hypothetical protein [Portunus trituberculatus]